MDPRKLILLCILFAGLSFRTDAQGTSPCPVNIDFEDGTTTNWNFFIGTCCPISTPTSTPPMPGRHEITSGSAVDPYGGFPIVSPGGGFFSMHLGNDTTGAQAEKARYYVDVPSGVLNYCLVYRYAVVLEDPGHSPADQPRFEVNATDSATGAIIPCASYNYVATSGLPGFLASSVPSRSSGLTDIVYKDWSTASINLSGLGGTTVAIDFASGDCALGGHFGYGYLDMSCGLFQIAGMTCDDTATTITLTAPDGFEGYHWYDSSTFTILYGSTQTITIPIPPGATTFAVVLTPYTGYGCPDTLYSSIRPSHLVLNPTHDTAICGSASVTLTSGATDIAPPLTYIWSPATGLSCTTCANPVATLVGTTTYTVTVTDAAGCSKTATIRVSVDPVSGSVTSVNDTCFGYNNGSATETVAGGFPPFTYSWTTVPVQTLATATGLYAGTYSVTVTDNIGCAFTNVATILDGPVTVITVTGSTGPTTCGGSDGTITLNGLIPGSSFIVKYTFGGVMYTQTLIASGTGTVTLTGLAQGVYTNIGIITTHCPYNTVGPTTLSDPPCPIIYYIGSNTPVCLGYPLDLYATTSDPGVTYSWVGPTGFTSGFQNPVRPGMNYIDTGYYHLTIVIHNCFARDSTYVVVKPLPIPSMSSNTPVCSGDTLYLNSSSSNGANTYVWNGPGGFYSNNQNPVVPKSDVSGSGTYTVTMTLNGCVAIDSMNVVINQTPDSPGTLNLEYCQKDPTVALTATGINLTWYTQPVGGSGTVVPPIPPTLLEGTTTWYVSQTSPEGCESIRNPIHVQVDYLADPYIDLQDSVICMGNTFLFYAKNTGNDMTGIRWAFENGDSIHNVNPLRYSFAAAGTYTVSVTTYYKVCPVQSTSKTITVYNQPLIDLGPDTTICLGSTPIIFKDNYNPKNVTKWLWSTGETGSTLTITRPGTYYVRVSISGCVTTDTIHVGNDCYLDIPNVFSPNGDGMNDYFFPRQSLTKGLTGFKMDIFNRWGQQIFTTSNIDGMGWDGKFNNEPQPEGVYIYVIEATFRDGQKEQHQGNITLLR